MDSLYLWPQQPALSLFVLWVASVVFLWAAREPMLDLVKSVGGLLEDAFRGLSRGCRSSAEGLAERTRTALLAAGQLDAQGKIEREIHRIDATYTERLGQYSKLHRKLDDLLAKLETDYHDSEEAPPAVPGWTAAVESIAQIPATSDPNVQKVLESIRSSSRDAEKKTLQAYRDDTKKRHGTLAGMAPSWKGVKHLMERMRDAVSKALESTRRIHAYVEEYDKVREDQAAAARVFAFSATKLFVVSLFVLGVALGGAFVNFQLISLPMSELVPAGARVGGFPVASVSALVIVLMETALGIFLMEMLGITDLFPKLQSIAPSRRKLVLGVSLAGLFFLASVESSLAVLREQIVEAEAALKLSLAGEESRLVTRASNSAIPVIGQAVLGFVLPWVLALVAIPLEMLLDSARHVMGTLGVLALQGIGHLSGAAAQAARSLGRIVAQLYDVYIAIPLRIEQAMRSQPRGGAGGGDRTRKRSAPATGEVAAS
jgi:hypothetical protein